MLTNIKGSVRILKGLDEYLRMWTNNNKFGQIFINQNKLMLYVVYFDQRLVLRTPNVGQNSYFQRFFGKKLKKRKKS